MSNMLKDLSKYLKPKKPKARQRRPTAHSTGAVAVPYSARAMAGKLKGQRAQIGGSIGKTYSAGNKQKKFRKE